MENCKSSESVRVAVNIRPLVTTELLVGCTDIITVYPAQKQVKIGSHSFTFDSVYGGTGSPSSTIYDECVAPLVDALFHGYNGTCLAYGQTGSGKTYTMGTNYDGKKHGDAIIPKVMDTIFSKVEAMKETTEFFIRVSFIEVYKEEVFDLLDPKTTGPARVPIQIREKGTGGITLAGVTEAEVRTKGEMVSFLLQGSLTRATGSTKMNSQSSRSHAIFTISMEQRRIANSSDDGGDDVLIAKLHLVDLAGSERAKQTGADGSRLQEGIHINKGLLVLGNVISALGDDKNCKEGGHVPYRESKLTRVLQDSLGGNCKTIMIACVSPADTNAEVTLNTLKYANRARNIQNKAIINRDPAIARKAPREASGSNKGPGIPALVQTIEHELEVTIGAHEVRSEHERQMKERDKRVEELERLKEEALSERQRENVMNFLFNVASSFGCQLRDKDSEIRDLKEEIVNLKLMLEGQSNVSDRHAYDLRSSVSCNSDVVVLEDTDTSYGEIIDLCESTSSSAYPPRGVCSCTRMAYCVSSRCECRAASDFCSSSCSCSSSRCCNKVQVPHVLTRVRKPLSDMPFLQRQ